MHPSILPCLSTHLAVSNCPGPTQTLSTWRRPALLLPALQFSLYHQILPRASGPEPHPWATPQTQPPIHARHTLILMAPQPLQDKATPLPHNKVHNCPGPAYLSSPVLYIPSLLLNTLAIYLSPKWVSQFHASIFCSCCSLCLKCFSLNLLLTAPVHSWSIRTEEHLLPHSTPHPSTSTSSQCWLLNFVPVLHFTCYILIICLFFHHHHWTVSS